MEHIFVLKDKGTINQSWWLKISTMSELEDYIGTLGGKIIASGIFKEIRYKQGTEHEDQLASVIRLKATNDNSNIYTAAFNIQADMIRAQVDALQEGPIFINSFGGWHVGGEYSDFIRSDKLVFPDFTKEHIRVKQFPEGTHYYAYIGNTQVHDCDTYKWNTYDEAYKQALRYIGENN